MRSVGQKLALRLVVVGLAALVGGASCAGGANGAPSEPVAAATTLDAATASVVLYPYGHQPVTVKVELARSDAERTKGLMFRRELAPDHGMLFLFDEDEIQTFWMKNTLIPLDMIFIRGDFTVAGVVEKATPQTLDGRSVGVPSRYVLEVKGGWAREHGVAADTSVRFEGIEGPSRGAN